MYPDLRKHRGTNHSKFGYILRLLVGIDQTFNVLLFNGSPDSTISGRVGYMSYMKGGWYWKSLEKIINTIFFFDKDHCRNSIELLEINNNHKWSHLVEALCLWGFVLYLIL